MAITKIWAVKSRLDKSLNYISNPQKTSIQPDIDAREGVIKYIENENKTEQCKYVAAYGCSEDLAFSDMIATQMLFEKKRRKNGVVAYHIVQSFKDFETTPEIAHKCGREFVERLFEEKYECILATHLDHEHLHNHIIINATSFVDGSKYKNNFKDYFVDIRGVSDAICRENCLSVIEKPKRKGMHYAEYRAYKNGLPTIRGEMRIAIDECIKCSYTYKDFWANLEKRGFKIHRRGEHIKHTSVISPNGKRPIRLNNLGDLYTEEAIFERIKTNRNGIRIAMPTELQKKMYRINGKIKNIKGEKLKGFMALYFKYLYLFNKIRKKQIPQRISFYMRDELLKFERYKKQFKFLVENKVETGDELQRLQKEKECKVDELTERRSLLYKEMTEENEYESKGEIKEINSKLIVLRNDIRMCKRIFRDSMRLSEKVKGADNLTKQAEMEMRENEHKRRSR